jgi:RNA polymerase sigma-70 factor (ECF subfamily)
MTGPTATTGARTEQTTPAKRKRILRKGRPGTGTAAAHVAALYEQHGATVLGICRRLLRDPAEAEDAAQQTFLSAQRALQNGSRPREPAAWLATIARNECVARTHARAREPLPTDAEPPATSADTHAEAVRRESVENLRDALESLPGQQREAILLREMRGLSYDEVASSLAVTPAAVESLLFRARKGLQLRLRGASAALSPVGWLASVRDLWAQIATGGDSAAGPAAAKAVAIGLGTAVVAGGALVGPAALRHRSHHTPRHAAAPTAGATSLHATATPTAPAEAAAPEQPKPVAAAGATVSRPRISRVPAALREDGGRSSPVQEPSEDRRVPTIWPTQTTPRDDAAPTSGASDSSSRLDPEADGGPAAGGSSTTAGSEGSGLSGSEIEASTIQPTPDTASQTAPAVASAPARQEPEGADDGGNRTDESERESGD